MDLVWAPWRNEYISSEKDESCFFCELANAEPSVDNLLLYRNDRAMVMLNRYPYTSGHLMVAPLRHISEFEDLSAEENLAIMSEAQKVVQILKELVKAQGFNIGYNINSAAGAGHAAHLHLHIVPRWAGDANFMTVVSQTRVISQSLEEIYCKIVEKLS